MKLKIYTSRFVTFIITNKLLSFYLLGSEWRLIVISGHEFVGYLPGGVEVYCITKVTLIPLTSENIDLGILELEVFY